MVLMKKFVYVFAAMIVFSVLLFAGCKEAPEPAVPIIQAEDAPAQEDTAPEDIAASEDDGKSNEEEQADGGSTEEYELEYSLADMEQILNRGMYFIVGNKAPAMDVVTISEIKSALTDKSIETGNAKLADEVDDYTTEDYIVIGSPCDNPVAAELLKNEIKREGNCNIFEPNTAWIKIFQTSEDHVALFIGGDSAVYTRIAAKVVGNYDDYNLMGTAVEVTGPADRPGLNLLINS